MALKKNARIKGVTVDINGNANGLGNAVSEAQRHLTTMNRSLRQFDKQAEEAFKTGADTAEIYRGKQAALKEALKAAQEQVTKLKAAQEEATKQIADGTNHAELDADAMVRLAAEVQNAELQLRRLQNEQQLVDRGFINQADAARQAAQAQKELAEKTAKAQQELEKVNTNLGHFFSSQTSLGNLKNSLTELMTAIQGVAAAAGAALTAASGYVVKVGTAFESSMSKVQALSGASEQEFEALSAAAKEMGATTSKTAAQAADALGYMALAGWDTQQMLGGLEPILRASEAGAMDLATCSDLVTDSMSAMGIQVDDLGHYLDVVAEAQRSSNTNMQQLLSAYVQCGGTLRNLNVDIEESATLIGELANRGKKGEEAGTALNSIMVNLIGANRSAKTAMDALGISAWDANGNFIGLTETLQLLSDRLNDPTLSEADKNNFIAKIGGKTQMDTLQALLAGVNEEGDALFETLSDCSGAAEDTAKTMQKNLTGALTMFTSALEGVGIEVYESFKEPLTDAVNEGTDMLSLMVERINQGDLTESVGKIAESFGKALKSVEDFAINDALPSLINVLEWISDHGDAVVAVLKGIGVEFVSMKVISPIIMGVAAAVDLVAKKKAEATLAELTNTAATAANTTAQTANAAAAQAATTAQIGFNAAQKANVFAAVLSVVIALTSAVISYVGSLESVSDKLDKINEKTEETNKQIEDTYTAAAHNEERFQQLAKTYEVLRDRYNETGEGAERLKEVVEELNGLSPTTLDLLDEETGKYRELAGEVDNVVAAMKRKRELDKTKSTWDAAMDNLDEKKELYAQAQKEYMDYLTKYQGDSMYDDFSGINMDKLTELKQAETDALAAVKEQEKAVSEIEKQMNGLYETEEKLEKEANAKKPADYASEYAERMEKQEADSFTSYAEWQTERFKKFEEEYTKLKEAYEVGDIEDENTYRQELHALLAEYGDKNLEEYHKYYKEMHKLDNNYNKQLTKEEKQRQKEALSDLQAAYTEEFDTLKTAFQNGELESEEEFRERFNDLVAKYGKENIKNYSKDLKTVEDLITKDKKNAETESLKNTQEFYKSQADAAQKSVDKQVKAYTEGMKEIEKSHDTFKNKLSAVDLFDDKKIADINEQVQKVKKYRSDLDKLKEKGLSDEMLESIRGMSLDDGAALAKQLNGLSANGLKLWMSDYKALMEESEEFADDQYKDETDKFRENFATQITSITRELVDDAKTTGLSFAQAFLSGVDQGIGGNLKNLLYSADTGKAAANFMDASSDRAGMLTSGSVQSNIQGGDVVFTIDGNVIGRAAVSYINNQAAQGGTTIKF